jgi:hypothetical protein
MDSSIEALFGNIKETSFCDLSWHDEGDFLRATSLVRAGRIVAECRLQSDGWSVSVWLSTREESVNAGTRGHLTVGDAKREAEELAEWLALNGAAGGTVSRAFVGHSGGAL